MASSESIPGHREKYIVTKIVGRGRGLDMAVALPEIAHLLFNSPLVTRVLRFYSTKLLSVSLDTGDSKGFTRFMIP